MTCRGIALALLLLATCYGAASTEPRFSCPEEDISFGKGNANEDLINELYDVPTWEDCGNGRY